MKQFFVFAALVLSGTTSALAWSNHALASYRAFEVMPEVAQAAPVTAEPLEAFLAAQAAPIAARASAPRPWTLKPPNLWIDCGVSPRWACTGTSAATSASASALAYALRRERGIGARQLR